MWEGGGGKEYFVVGGGSYTSVFSLGRGTQKGMSSRVFPNLPLCKQLFFISLLLSCFVKNKYFHGNRGTNKT